MGKVIFEFDSVEEASEIQDAFNGGKWKLAMWYLDQKLRAVDRQGYSMFGNQEASDDELKTVREIRDEIRRLMSEYNLELES